MRMNEKQFGNICGYKANSTRHKRATHKKTKLNATTIRTGKTRFILILFKSRKLKQHFFADDFVRFSFGMDVSVQVAFSFGICIAFRCFCEYYISVRFVLFCIFYSHCGRA